MKSGGKRALARVIASVMVFGVIGGGLAYTKITVDAADRTAPTKAWKSSQNGLPGRDFYTGEKNPNNGRTDTALSKALLPVPDEYQLGPDIGELGNDVHLSGRKAEAWLSGDAEAFPAPGLATLRHPVRGFELQGMALRSYAHSTGHNLLVRVRLAKAGNRNAVKKRSNVRSDLIEALPGFREGEKIDGHENAECVLLPKPDTEAAQEIDHMFCTAYEDDILVTLTAVGTAPFAQFETTEILRKQLDRLTVGGGISA